VHDSWIHEMSFARWRHFITARGSNWSYQRAVLSLIMIMVIIIFLLSSLLIWWRKIEETL